ncbi:hypothetical protein DES53_11668 [Roseimicrobium gellanilyticum]|uniref:Lipocalin-like protein n=1 Tax=Roseimicrobium gellanilyticum TaxID=748857 RepID=A0A366H4T9_9BACT|nr:hypothetical protein [Roseimicrobium gellanilyticum]RBP36629.1 hypothetical protein DES53_11668 [Roseimicrobium gellanilyticum]
MQAHALDPFVRPDVDSTLLPGTYQRTIGGLRQTITFHEGGTFTGKSWTARNTLDDEYSGDWYWQGGYALPSTLNYVVRKSHKIPKDTEDADIVIVLNQKCLSILPADGKSGVIRVWWRVEEKVRKP